jgi:hypothetical protein
VIKLLKVSLVCDDTPENLRNCERVIEFARGENYTGRSVGAVLRLERIDVAKCYQTRQVDTPPEKPKRKGKRA